MSTYRYWTSFDLECISWIQQWEAINVLPAYLHPDSCCKLIYWVPIYGRRCTHSVACNTMYPCATVSCISHKTPCSCSSTSFHQGWWGQWGAAWLVVLWVWESCVWSVLSQRNCSRCSTDGVCLIWPHPYIDVRLNELVDLHCPGPCHHLLP